MHGLIPSSLARITDLEQTGFSVEALPREQWETGDYVVGRVVEQPPRTARIELPSGRRMELAEGDRILGAFGIRAATLEAVGDWRAIGDDGRMDVMTGTALFGKVTSRSRWIRELIRCRYEGHITIDGEKRCMRDYVRKVTPRPLTKPVILIVGTSMSAGKTTCGRVIVRRLSAMGKRVIAAKLTGAARYHDVQSLGDAGAEPIFDFVDVGLPSTVCPPDEYRSALRELLAMIEEAPGDIVVIEAGASPLEPYNGDTAVSEVESNVCFTLLCASDPYAVLGVMHAFARTPDLVSGVAASTSASIELVEKLTDVPCLDLLDPTHLPRLDVMLRGAVP